MKMGAIRRGREVKWRPCFTVEGDSGGEGTTPPVNNGNESFLFTLEIKLFPIRFMRTIGRGIRDPCG